MQSNWLDQRPVQPTLTHRERCLENEDREHTGKDKIVFVRYTEVNYFIIAHFARKYQI